MSGAKIAATYANAPQMAASDPLPRGPFVVDLTKHHVGQQVSLEPPWIVRSESTRQCVAGWIDSKACADAIADALNKVFPP